MKLTTLLRYRSRSKALEKIAREIRFRAERLHSAERGGKYYGNLPALRRSLTLAIHRLSWKASDCSRMHSSESIRRQMRHGKRP